MGRPREFDVDEAADRARNAFWVGGYEGTSLSDIAAATGQSAGSLYKAFGSKEALHREGLRRYLAQAEEELKVLLCDADGETALRAWLASAARTASAGGPRAGCYAVLTETEPGACATGAADMIREYDGQLLQLAGAALARSVLREGLDPVRCAPVLLSVVKGLQVRGRSGISPEEAQDIVDTALEALLRRDPQVRK